MSNFEIFRRRFKGNIVTPEDPGYEKTLDRWAANTVQRAAVVAFVKDIRDVTLAIGYARASGLRIAIRGGGYSVSGASSVDGGLVIDLSRYFNNVRIDAAYQLAYAQGGATWRAVDSAAIQYGLACVAGTVNHSGVGGFTLGGGCGWLSGAHGLAIDNLVQATIVTADGRVLVTSEGENADLFWGIRGGGSNFGVVTEFVFRLHPQRRKVFAGRVIFSPDCCNKIAAFLDDWWPRAKPVEGMIVSLMTMHYGAAVMCFVFYNGTEEDGRNAYKGLFDIGPISDWAAEVPYEQLNSITNSVAEWGANYYSEGVLLGEKPSLQLNAGFYQQFSQIATTSDHTVAVTYEYIPRRAINDVPAYAAPYPRYLPGHAVVQVQWRNHTLGKALVAHSIARRLAALMPEGDNYAIDSTDTEPSTAATTFFRDHYPTLQVVKKTYDPDVVFDQWCAINPA